MHIIINALSARSGGGISVAAAYGNYLSKLFELERVSVVICPAVAAQVEVSERLAHSGCRIENAPDSFRKTMNRTFGERSFIHSLINQNENSDTILIQLNGMLPIGFPLALKSVLLVQDPSAYVAATYGNARSRFGSWIRRQVQRWSLARADLALYTSNYIRELITSHHSQLPAVNRVVYNGVPELFEEKAFQEPVEPNTFRILTVSNVARYKGQFDVIRAIGKLNRDESNGVKFYYDIVGAISDLERSALMALVEAAGMLEFVSLHGRISDAARDALLVKADLFAHLSRCESFGIPVIEAMNEGVPVLAANLTALPEIGGAAAVYCNPYNLDEVADRILMLAKDSGRRRAMVEDGYQNVKRFTWDRVMQSVSAEITALGQDR